MEENIPYRRLKKLKPNKISRSSERLLKPYNRQLSQSKHDQSIMSQNVTQFQYMLSQPHLKQNYIKWATNLRSYNKSKSKQQQNHQTEVPSVFYKKTAIQEIRQKLKEKNQENQINTAQYSQFFGKNSTNIPLNQLNFLNNLRQLNDKQKTNTLHDDKFKNYGYKDHDILPKLLKKTSIKKLRDYKENDFQSSFDGTHMYPEYSYKKLREKNSALISSLCKSHSNVSLPALAWQIGLRYY